MANSENQITPRLLKGFRDTLPEQLQIRNKLIHTITDIVVNFGFQPLETPALEYGEILNGKLGDEGEKLLYRFTDHGNRDVALRYDFTVPLARVAAQYPNIPKPFKRYQVGPVWRADNTQRGRYREFYQYDIDIIGADALTADAEILVLMQEILVALGVTNFKIRVNDRQAMMKIAQEYSLNEQQQKVLLTGLDKFYKVGKEGVIDYWQEQGLSQLTDENFIETFEHVTDIHNPNNELNQTLKIAQSLGLKPDNYHRDITIVRGLDYYTGLVFETTLLDAPDFGSIFSGGRYDGLIGRFSRNDIPAVGASVGLDRLIAAMESLNILPDPTSSTKVFVSIFNSETQNYSFNLARRLRESGISTEVSYNAVNLGKQIKLANSKNISYVVIAGPDEVASNRVVLRDIRTGQQQILDIDKAIEFIKAN